MKLSCADIETLLAMSPEEKWDLVCKDIKDDGETGDLALLLGTRLDIATQRAEVAAELYHAGRVKYILATGGVKWKHGDELISEADWMKQVLMEEHVPEDAILLDNEARTTLENMICSTLVISRTVRLSKISKVIIVTSQTHMQRSLALAKALLPRKFHLSACPCFHEKPVEQWLAVEKNQKTLNLYIELTKNLIDNGIVEDIEF